MEKGFRFPPAATCCVKGCNNYTPPDSEQELQGNEKFYIASICITCEKDLSGNGITIKSVKCGEYNYAEEIIIS